MSAVAAFVVMLAFTSGHAGQKDRTLIDCPDWDCVEEVLDHAHESRLLSRLRVFHVGETVFQPVLDWQLQ